MKKFIFTIFAICLYGPSFGACNHIYDKIPAGSQYLESRFSFNGKPTYLQCGGTAEDNAECAKDDIVVGRDGFLYRCNNNVWDKLDDNDKELKDCKTDIRSDLVGLTPTYMGNNAKSEYIYLVKTYAGTEKTFYRCKYPRKNETDTRDKCIISCGDYYSGICNRNRAKDITIKIVDTTGNAITNASIKYPNLTAPNNTINIATQKGNGDYALCLNETQKNLNIQISAQGYSPTTKTVADLLNSKTITLQRNNNSTSQKQGPALPAAANEQSSIMDTSSKLIITCENKGDINCELPNNHGLKTVEKCNELSKKNLSTDVLYLDSKSFKNCSEQIQNFVTSTKCPALQRAFVGQSKYILFCIDNPKIEIRHKSEQTDSWSYAKKQCVGSWGEWDDNTQSCNCNALDGTTLVGNECLCTSNNKQKYYSKLWAGCETLRDGVSYAGTTTKIYGLYSNLSDMDRANSCPPSGGTWGGKGKNECLCNHELNMELDSTGYFCNCKADYDYQDPMAKSDGCIPKKDISNYSSSDTNDESQVSEQVVPTGTKKAECIKSGGDDYKDDKCICNANDHLEEYNPENAKEYSICRCMDGYKRNNETNEATGECVYAPEIKTQIERDDMAMQRDAEDAYRNEYDNAQSWANKGTTALSTLATGEGAMMAARAIAEKIADDDAEEKMSEYITTMKCEYGGGQSVNLGDTETLPGGNELANYYTEYKQLAEKLKATKAALNLRPGIEAEVLYDRAETGLYQYQTAERQSGGFTSLSRALMDPTGTDAEQWNAQRTETNRNLWVGGALATVGLAGSYIANRAINKDHVKKYKELEEKFREIKIQLEHEYPEIFIPTPEDPAVEEVEVEVEQEPTIEPSPQQSIPQPIPLDSLRVSSEAFKRGYASLTSRGRDGINRAIELITNALNDYDIASTSMNITAIGHSDPDGINQDYVKSITNNYKTALGNTTYFTPIDKINTNELLSKARAQVVVTALLDEIKNRLSPTRNPTYHVDGTDGKECTKPKTQYEQCRYVEIDIKLAAIPKVN